MWLHGCSLKILEKPLIQDISNNLALSDLTQFAYYGSFDTHDLQNGQI